VKQENKKKNNTKKKGPSFDISSLLLCDFKNEVS